jgi:hypothetical protein
VVCSPAELLAAQQATAGVHAADPVERLQVRVAQALVSDLGLMRALAILVAPTVTAATDRGPRTASRLEPT